jgi:hypothetical protein
MLHVSLLGEKVISDAAGILRTPSSRSIALVAFLVLHASFCTPRSRSRGSASRRRSGRIRLTSRR